MSHIVFGTLRIVEIGQFEFINGGVRLGYPRQFSGSKSPQTILKLDWVDSREMIRRDRRTSIRVMHCLRVGVDISVVSVVPSSPPSAQLTLLAQPFSKAGFFLAVLWIYLDLYSR
jgi:hypothetical protein